MHKNFVPPISIEEFAAYLDGNLSEEEMNKITSVINIEDNLQAIMSNCHTIDNSMASYERFEQIIPKDILSDDFVENLAPKAPPHRRPIIIRNQ